MPLNEQPRHSPIDDAELYLERGDREEAVTCLERAAGADPYDEEVRLLAAMIHYQDGRLARAAELALAAVRIRPFHPSALNMIAICCLEGGYDDVGREILERVKRTAPGFDRARRNLKASVRRRGGEQVPGLPPRGIRRLLDERDPRLSVCVLCTEGRASLDPFVESLAGSAAEVVVVDAVGANAVESGSVPVTVHTVGWTDDASALRNEAIRRATGDWILVLEPHERIVRSSLPELIAATRSLSSLSATVEIREESGSVSHLETRLFRNAPGVSYSGSVYPRVDPSLEVLRRQWKLGERPSGVSLSIGPVRAYAADRRSDRERLDALTHADLKRNPEQLYLALQRARVAVEIGEVQHALDVLEKIRPVTEERGTTVEREEQINLEARCLIARDRAGEAMKRIREYHREATSTANTLFLEGCAARALGKLDDAVALLRRAQNKAGPSRLPRQPEARGAQLQSTLGATLLDLGRLEEAQDVFVDAIDRDPGNATARMGLLGTRLARGQLREMLEDLDRWVEAGGEDSQVWSFGGMLLGKVPALAEVAQEWMDEACRRFPDHEDLRWQLVGSRLRCGDAEQALEALEELPRRTPDEMAGHFAASLAAGVELPPVPTEERARVEDAVMGWLQTWRDSSAWSTLDQVLLEIHRAEPELPGLPTRAAAWLEEIGQVDAASRIRRAEPALEPGA